MAPIKQTLQHLRWYQWLLAALVLLYVIYIALSYLYLPGKLQAVVQQDVAELIGRDISVQRIAFDPFGLALEVEQFSIADRPQQPLLEWQRFYVNVELWKSLFGWQLRLAQVDLDQPHINIERRKDDFNFSSILERFPADEKPVAAEEKTQFAIQVDAINIRDGRFELDDISGSKPAKSSLDQVTLGVQNLYLATGDDQLNPFNLQAEMPGGGKLTLSGEYRADPVLVHSEVDLQGLQLAKFADFVENVVPVRINDGSLSVKAKVDLEQKKEFEVQVKQGEVALRQLALDDAQLDPPLARVQQLDVKGIELDLRKQAVVVDSLSVNGFEANQWMKDNGEIRYQHLLVESAIDANTAASTPEPEAPAWSFQLKDTTIKGGRVSFTDMSGGLNAVQKVNDIGLNLKNISLEKGVQIPLQVSANINDGGLLTLDGQMILVPFALEMKYQLQNLPLLPVNPYVEANTWLQVQQGTLSVDGDVKLETTDPMPLNLNANISLADVQAEDTRSGKKILQWKALNLQQLRLDLLQRTVNVETVELQQPDIAAEIGSDKQMNLGTLVKTSEAAPANSENAAAPVADEKPFQVVINTVAISDGTARFRDASVEPAFKTGLFNMTLNVRQLTNNGPQPASFDFSSKIDKYAPFNAKGTLVPLDQQPGFAFKSQLKGLEMPNLSPYTGTYIGYQLQSGKLALDLDYELKQRHLKGKNTIVAKQLYLGDEVQSEQAVDAPVALGLALLRDMNGVIDLDVGVSGDLDDPGFSIGGIVLKTLMNVIVKAATSPFQLLGSLVGGSEDLGKVEFAAGGAELTPEVEEKLSQLVTALAQRPQLMVNIKGSAGMEDDAAALQLARVRDLIAQQRKKSPADLPLETLLEDKANRNALEDINDELKLPDEGDREDALQAANAELKGNALTRQVYQQMLQDVAAQQTIGQQDLQSLADQRALAIKQFLVESAKLDHSRIQMAKTRQADLKGRVCELGLAPG